MTIDENGWNHDLREKLGFTPVTLAAAHLSVFLPPNMARASTAPVQRHKQAHSHLDNRLEVIVNYCQ
jgi:hypothetical protein